MRKLTVMKSMSKTIFALCIALSILVCNSATIFAVASNETPNRAGHVHIFNECCRENDEYSTPELTHSYLYGVDHNGKEIYKTCVVIYTYQYCHYICSICGESENGRHTHVISIRHSDNHA